MEERSSASIGVLILRKRGMEFPASDLRFGHTGVLIPPILFLFSFAFSRFGG